MGEKKKARVRIRKLELSKFVAFVKPLAKRRRSSASLGENDPVEYAIKTRRLCNAVRAHDRTSRVLVGGYAKDGALADAVGFFQKSIVPICTPP